MNRGFFFAALLLVSIVCVHITNANNSLTTHADNDGEVLIKLARDLRDGTNDVKVNLNRAVHFFEYVIEKGAGKLVSEAVWELYTLLEAHPALTSKLSSWDLLVKSAEFGHQDAQHQLSAALATGIFRDGIVPTDPTRSLVLEYVSALSGNPTAAMSMGYRYYFGLGVPESCEKALPFYEYAANTAAKYLEEKGYTPVIDRSRLNDVVESQSKGQKNEFTVELADYYAHLAETGDSNAATTLGTIYSTGLRLIPIDQDKAIYFLELAAKQNYGPGCGLLGYLLVKKYLSILHSSSTSSSMRQEEANTLQFPPDLSPERIANLLQIAVKANDVNGMVGQALAYNYGIGVPMNQTKALETLQKYSLQHPDAGYHLAEILVKSALSHIVVAGGKLNNLRNHDLGVVIQGYSASSQHGNILAQHRLAHLANRGVGIQRNCESVLTGFKTVAERGPWSEALNIAQQHFLKKEYAMALHIYAQLAVLGIEPAQFNAAYLLKNHHCPHQVESKDMMLAMEMDQQTEIDAETTTVIQASNISSVAWKQLTHALKNGQQASSRTSSNALQAPSVSSAGENAMVDNIECESRALTLFGLSASQGNAESFVTIGDFYYYGLAGLNASRPVSTIYYQKAAELHNTQAIFNLGLMHELGDGVSQDFHLAKRYFDMAAEVDPKAKVPRDIALFMMDIHKKLLVAFDCSILFESDPTNIEKCNEMLLHSKEVIMSLLQKALVWDRYIRDILDQFFSHFGAYRSSTEISTTATAHDKDDVTAKFLKYQIMHPLRTLMEKVSNPTFLESEMSFNGIKVTGQELICILTLSLFLSVLLIIRRYVANLHQRRE